MPATTDQQPSADSSGTPATVGGGITRLNPSDGLFLRAQHLTTMEDYARQLSLAVGVAAGTGVVYGYHVWLEDTTLKVDAGLAIAPDGRPLRSGLVAEFDISGLAVTDDEFFVVEVAPAGWDFGQENMYGNLCTDPCSQGGQIQPYRAEGITIKVRPDTMPGLSSVQPTSRQRNWLASHYYERERERAGPWLVPSDTPVPALATRHFSCPTAAPRGDAVALAALLKPDSTWVVDVWIARRDIGDPAPRRAWQSRLAMRPWDVFIAQVLQFQAQFATDYTAGQVRAVQPDTAGEIAKAIAGLREGLGRQRVRARYVLEAVDELEKAAEGLAEAAQAGLCDQGFCELPPAGYLPVPPNTGDVATWAASLFGAYVDLRICPCRADDAVRAVEQAQHLDRIPLDPSQQRGTPRVDVLVPSDLADLGPLYAESYPWVAFVRRPKAACGPRDEVAVYLIDAGADAAYRIAERILKDRYRPPEKDLVASLSYPADTYAVPQPHEDYQQIHEKIHGLVGTRKDYRLIGVGLASAVDRQPLAAVRTFLLTLEATADGLLESSDVLVGYEDGLSPEVIVLIVGTGDTHG